MHNDCFENHLDDRGVCPDTPMEGDTTTLVPDVGVAGSKALACLWKFKISIQALTRKLSKHRRCEQRRRRQMREDDLQAAWKVRNLALVPRLARELSGTGIGLKNRNYRSLPTATPSRGEWKQFLEKPGIEGGLAATEAEVPQFFKPDGEYIEALKGYDGDPDIEITATDEALAWHDIAMLKNGLWKSKHRKFAPRWSAPAELWKIICLAEYTTKPESMRSGIGSLELENASRKNDGSRTKRTHKHLVAQYPRPLATIHKIFALARAVEALPFQSAVSIAFAPDKKMGRKGQQEEEYYMACASCGALGREAPLRRQLSHPSRLHTVRRRGGEEKKR